MVQAAKPDKGAVAMSLSQSWTTHQSCKGHSLALSLPQEVVHATAFNLQAFVVPDEALLRR